MLPDSFQLNSVMIKGSYHRSTWDLETQDYYHHQQEEGRPTLSSINLQHTREEREIEGGHWEVGQTCS